LVRLKKGCLSAISMKVEEVLASKPINTCQKRASR
jgi:hypothetical protein